MTSPPRSPRRSPGPIQIVSVQVENIDFSEAYEQSVEQRMLAQVQIQQREQNLQNDRGRSADRADARRRRSERHPLARRRGSVGHSCARGCAARQRRSGSAPGGREMGRQAADDDDAGLGSPLREPAAGPVGPPDASRVPRPLTGDAGSLKEVPGTRFPVLMRARLGLLACGTSGEHAIVGRRADAPEVAVVATRPR